MAGADLKRQLSLFAELVEAFSEFLIKTGEIEKEGLPFSRFYDREYWSEIGKKLFTELPKDVFVTLMGLWYELGKLSATNLMALNADERIKLANDMKKYAQQIKETLRR